ncbi:MAG: tail fiber domain-containing protein [Clostridiales bacterium]|nr:tail fiber domain-containing protein [Clostridiales bacterium]
MKASNQLTILNIEEQTYEDICTHDTTTGLIECTHAQDQGCVRVTEIQGKSEQVQSTLGKNLLDIKKYGDEKMRTSWTIEGITATFNSDNSLTCTGKYTGSQPNYIFTYFTENLLPLLKVGEAYFSYTICKIIHKDGTIEYTDRFTVNDTIASILMYYQLPVSSTLPKTYYPMICLITQVTAYEPFIPNSPSPDYPSVINSVGDSGKLNVVSSVGRRNLFENSSEFMMKYVGNAGTKVTLEKIEESTSPYEKAIKVTITEPGTSSYSSGLYSLMPMNKMTPGKKYTWSLYLKSDNLTTINKVGHERGGQRPLPISSEWKKYTFTYTMASTGGSAFVFYSNFKTGDNIYIHSFKLEEGEEYSDWTPAPEDITPENYKQYEDKLSLASVNLISPLRSLPNGVHDVLECKDGIWGVTRNVGNEIWNGSETWTKWGAVSQAGYFVTYHRISSSQDFNAKNFLCSHFVYDPRIGAEVGFAWHLNTPHITVQTSTANSVDEFKTWLSKNNVTLLYALATQAWEPLDDPSQIALNNLLSYSGKNYIYTTDPLATNFSVAVKSRAFYENFKLQEEIKNTNSSLGDLDDEIKGGFYDGIINVNEAEAIRKAAETMHTQVTNQFNKVDSNPSLTGTPKSTHQTKYTECNNAYNTLISKINTAIDYCSVNSTKTDAQKKTAVADMNTAFGTYKTKLADYQKAYQDAIDAIAKKKADDAVDDVVIGGRNLFRQSGHWEKLPDTKYWRNNGGAIDLDTTVKYLGYNTLRTTVGSGISGYFDDWIELDTNKIYTYSAMIKASDNVTGLGNRPLHYHCSYDKANNSAAVDTIKFQQSTIANQWTLLYLTFKPKGKYWRPFVYMGSGSTIFNIAYLKLEEGTKPTDWTPNIEDTDEKITEVSATLTSTISDVKFIVDEDHKNITNKVWKTDIITGIKDLNVGGINLWDLSAIKRYASGSLSALTGATIDAKAGKITVSANSEGVPGCKIDTSTLTRNTSNIGELVITGYYDRPDSDSNKFENVFLYYKCFNSSNAEVQAHTKLSLPVETSSKLFATTISIPANTAYINFGVGQFPYVKPYTLTGITVKDSALYDITKGLRDQVSQAYQDISGFKQNVKDTYTTKTEFDQLSVSGRNLLRNTSYEDNIEGTLNRGTYHTISRDTVNKYNGNNSLKIVCNTVSISGAQDVWQYLWKEMILDKPVTASFYIKGSIATTGWMRVATAAVSASAQTFSITTSWKKIEIDFGKVILESDSSHIAELIYGFNATGTFYINSMMLEYSTKPSDWTPAPEDTDEKFTNYTTTTDMNSLINQTKSDIELGVSKAYTSKTEGDKITQGLNKWILEVYQLTSSSMPNPRVADIENIRGKVPTKIIEVADTAMSASLNTGDYYIGHAFTYLYFDAAYTWSGTIKTDDEGVVYLNGVKKVSTTTSVATNISLPFQAGWNVLEVVYNEGTSNDGWLFSSKLSTLSQCKIMNCYAQVSLNASALIKVTADAISQKVENDAAYAEFTEQAGKMAWLVKSGTEAANMELTPEALNVIADKINLTGKVTFSSLATDAKKKIEEAKQAGTDAQESLNNLTIGTRNLIPNTNQGTTGWNWSKENGSAEVTDIESLGVNACKFKCITASTGYQMITHRLNLKLLKPNTKYTVSFDIYTNMDFGIALWIARSNATGTFTSTHSQYCTANSWTKVQGIITSSTESVTLDSQILYMTGMNKTGIELTIANLQMVEGNKIGTWSPAPEDINDTISALGEDLQDQIDGKIESYNQTSDPSTAWTTSVIKTQHTGDIWYNDSTKLTQRWSGTAWMPLKDADAIAAQNLAQQKKRVFTATPTTPYDVGDLWVQGGTGEIMKCKTALASGSYNAAHWEKASKYTDDTTANQAVSNTVLTPADKISLYATFLNIQNEYNRLKQQCTNLGVADTLKTSYDALYALLNGIVGTTALQNATTSGFNKSNYDTLYKNYVTAREALEQAQISKVYEYTKEVKEKFTIQKALAVANWFAQQDQTMIDGAYIYTGTVTAKQITAENISGTNGWINLSKGTFNYNNKIIWDGTRLMINADSLSIGSAVVATQGYVTNSIKDKVDTSWLTQKNVFDKLTNNGSLQGIYMEGGKLYINGEYIKANSIDADRLIVGMNPNLVRYGMDTMEQFSTAPYFTKPATTTVTMDDTQYYVGTKSIKVIGTSGNNYVYLGTQSTDYGCIPVVTGKKYILSCYVKTEYSLNTNATIGVIGHTGISTSSLTFPANATKTLKESDGWVRMSVKYTATSDCPYISMRIIVVSGNIPMWFDAFQIEEVDDLGKEPGAFKHAGTTIINGENITTGTISDALGNISWNLASGVLNAKKLSIDSINFKLTEAGVVTAKSGIIGGWNITPESMNRQFTANNKNYWLYFDTGTTTDAYAAFMLRTKATTASAWEDKFSIAWNGKMTAMDADVRGRITATSGELSGFKIVSDKLYTEKTISGSTFESFVIKPNAGGTIDEPLMLVRSSTTRDPELIVTKDEVWIRRLITKEISPLAGNINVSGTLNVDDMIVTGSINLSNHIVWRLNGGTLNFAKMSNNESINMPYIANGSTTWTYNYMNITPSIQTMTIGAGGNVLNLLGTVKENGIELNSKYMGLRNENGFWGMAPLGNNSYWLRTTSAGIIPFQSGNAGSGHQTLGTPSWYFSEIRVDSVYYSKGLNKVSDRRSKENIQEISEDDSIDLLKNIKVKNFTYTFDKHKEKNYGIIAQDLRDYLIENNKDIFAGLSISLKDGERVYDLKAREADVTYAVDYTQFIPVLIKAMQYVLDQIKKE